MSIQISKEGRRHYLVGNTYAVKDALRDAGAHWDRDRGAWWTSKADVAERFAAAASEKAAVVAAVKEQTANDARVAVSGNTYPVRDELRALGGEWDASNKTWMVPVSKAAEAQALVAKAPKASFARRGSRSSGSSDYYRRGGERLVRGCADCSRLGRMCRQCQFDDE